MGNERYVNVDRNTPMLLPPDLREWIEEDDLAHFILAAVEGADLSLAKTNKRGSGSAQYPPSMMLAVLLYNYATGVFGSRQIEAMTYRNVSVRYLAGNEHPDHDTICKFRRENGALVHSVFLEVLKLAGKMKFCKVGTICVDGTKIKANASKRRTFKKKELDSYERGLSKQIEELLSKAEEADTSPVDDGTRVPRELRDKEALKQRIAEAKEQMRQQAQEAAAAAEADLESWHHEPVGERPSPKSSEITPDTRINLSDPDSGFMPQSMGPGYIQGYNAQLVVSAERTPIILAAAVCDSPNDRQQLEPMVRAAVANAPQKIDRIVSDSGFENARQIQRLERELGMGVFCPTQTKPKEVYARRSRGKQLQADLASRAIRKRLYERSQTEEGKAMMRLRSTTVEPVFGLIKSVLGFNRFQLRGLKNVNIEWQLLAAAFNCRRLSRSWKKPK